MSRRKKTLDTPLKLQVANPFKTKVYDYFGPYATRVTGPRIGVEIEVESDNNRFAGETDNWRAITDGSLRGPNGERDGGREYVSRQPMTFANIEKHLADLDAAFKAARVKNAQSIRTSVHVHLNVQDLTLTQLVNLICLYYVAEPVLCRYNGAARENNVFALQLQYAPTIIDELVQAFSERNIRGGTDALKYSALNIMPLFTGNNPSAFGTLEFRAGRGIRTRPSDCLRWIRMIQELYIKSLKFTTADDIVKGLSSQGVQGFLAENLPGIYEDTYHLFEPEELNATVIDSMRASQDLAFRIDWSDYQPVTKRKSKKKLPGVEQPELTWWTTGFDRDAELARGHGYTARTRHVPTREEMQRQARELREALNPARMVPPAFTAAEERATTAATDGPPVQAQRRRRGEATTTAWDDYIASVVENTTED